MCKELASGAELSPQSKVYQGVMRVCLVQRVRATLRRKLNCAKRVRSTRLLKSENLRDMGIRKGNRTTLMHLLCKRVLVGMGRLTPLCVIVVICEHVMHTI